MKHFALLCIFLLFLHYSVQIPKYENCCVRKVLPAEDRHRCIKVTCTSQNEYNIEECNCNKNTRQHLGERCYEYPACCPRCNKNKRH